MVSSSCASETSARVPNATDVESPDIEAKLAGLQKPRGWGLFLIKNMVDEIRVHDADGRHTVELVLELEGGDGDGNDRT